MGLLDRIWSFATAPFGRAAAAPLSPQKRRLAEELLTDEVHADYRPGPASAGLWSGTSSTPDLGRYFEDTESQLVHPAIVTPVNYVKASLANVVFSVEDASSPEHGEFALAELRRFWRSSRRAAQRSYDYGRGCGELVYTRADGALRLDHLRAFMPLDGRALTRGGRYVGMRLSGSSSGTARAGRDLWGPSPGLPAKGWWHAHDPRYSRFYGWPAFYAAWRPWKRLAGRDGAEDVVDGGVYRFGLMPFIGRYPPEDQAPRPGDQPGGVWWTNRDKMRQLLESLKSGGAVALSSRTEDGKYVWSVDPVTGGLVVSELLAYTDSLEKACSLGCGVPPELIEASEVGSGWSGRAIPLEVFYLCRQSDAEDLVASWYLQVGGPLLRWNFGPGAWAVLRVHDLLKERMKAGQAGQQPEKPQQQPPVRFSTQWGEEEGEAYFATQSGRSVGDVWKGPSGRWFTVRPDGRTVPARAPGAAGPGPKRAAGRSPEEIEGHIKALRDQGRVSAEQVHELAGLMLGLTVAQLNDLKKKLGLKASGTKYELASKLAARSVDRAGQKAGEKRGDERRKRDDAGRGGRAGKPDAGAGRPVEKEAGRPPGPGTDRGGNAGRQPAGPAAAERVPADPEEIGRRLERFEKFFGGKGQHHVAEWIGKLKEHVAAVGGAEALKALGQLPTGRKTEGDVQYWGVGTEEQNWKNMGQFMEAYLARNGIIAVTGESSSPGSPLISALGAPDRYVAGQDFKPEGMHFKNKLQEAKTLPGLEASADIADVVGRPVSHLTPDVTASLDEKFGPGQWIVKCYDDNAAAGYGIFFPQRAAQIAQDAKNTLWTAGEQVARYGFELRRDGGGKVVGLKHQGGDTYDFGTEKYDRTIGGDVRQWGDRAAGAASHEQGAKLPEGSFMVQPAFKAVGISDAERAAGKTWHEKNEGRVHLVTRPDGSVEVIPHSTWLKGGNLPVVFEDDDTRAMARAAKEAIEKIPRAARKGQVYAPDIMKTADGYKVVELNPQGDHNGSGYLHDNHFTIDAYVSHLTGREPAHVSFIRQLLTTRKGKKEGGG